MQKNIYASTSEFSFIKSVPLSEMVQHNATSKCLGRGVGGGGVWREIAQIQILALQPPGCVTSDNLFNLSELQFPYLHKMRIHCLSQTAFVKMK